MVRLGLLMLIVIFMQFPAILRLPDFIQRRKAWTALGDWSAPVTIKTWDAYWGGKPRQLCLGYHQMPATLTTQAPILQTRTKFNWLSSIIPIHFIWKFLTIVYQYVHTCRYASYLLQVIMQRQISVKYARYMRVWLFVYSDEREFLDLNNLSNCKLHSPKLLEKNILKNKQYKQTA